MSAHLTPEEIVDAAAGEADAVARRHVESCAGCAREVAEAREVTALAAGVEVPEPPPLYWEAFRRQVGRRVADEPRGLAWLAPVLAAAAALALAVWFQRGPVPVAPAPSAAALLPAWSPLPPAEDDAGLAVLRAFEMSDGDLASALPAEGVAGALANLSDEESADLAEALREAIGPSEVM